jgi:hypothetical protein
MMTDANIWMPLVGIMYVIPVFWLLDGFNILEDMAGSRWLAALWVLGWPVFMLADMAFGGDDE